MKFVRSGWLPLAAALVFGYVALKEYGYWHSHPYARGPSGEITAIAVAGFVLACHAAALAIERALQEGKRRWDAALRSETDDDER